MRAATLIVGLVLAAAMGRAQLLEDAWLYEPFKFVTPKGFRIQHNGALFPLNLVDEAFEKAAAPWDAEYPWMRPMAPFITEIVIFPARMYWGGCTHVVRMSVVPNGFALGYSIVINGGVDPAELPHLLEGAFSRLFQQLNGAPPVAWLERGCLE